MHMWQLHDAACPELLAACCVGTHSPMRQPQYADQRPVFESAHRRALSGPTHQPQHADRLPVCSCVFSRALQSHEPLTSLSTQVSQQEPVKGEDPPELAPVAENSLAWGSFMAVVRGL